MNVHGPHFLFFEILLQDRDILLGKPLDGGKIGKMSVFISILPIFKQNISILKQNFPKQKIWAMYIRIKTKDFKQNVLKMLQILWRCCTKFVCTFFQFLSLSMKDQLRSGMKPGSDPDFPEICPILIDCIFELKWTFSIIFYVLES